MANLFTYTIELRDRMSSTFRRVGGSIVDTHNRVRQLRSEIRSLNDTPLSGLKNSITNAFKNIPFSQYIFNPLTIAGVVGGRALKLGIDNEMRNASFEVLFGGEENARKMIDNISAYAAKSTYGKDTLSEAAQTMAGFGIAQERIMPNLKAISEIAMGDKNRLSALTLAFSQMSAAGSLMGQDLLQMVNAGFNPLLQISKETGKSVGVLKEEMSKGKISADMVAQAFQKATQEGGQFYGMSGKISQTLGGQFSAAMSNLNNKLLELYNAIQPMLMPVVKSFNLLLSDTGAFFDKLGEKINRLSTTAKVVGGVLLWLATTITIVKVATAAYAVVTKMITALKSAETLAWIANSLAIWANPITWIVAAVIALIGVIAFLIIKIDGWGETWANVVTFCKLSFQTFKENIVYQWLSVQDTFMSGLELIEAGWYKLQSLWNKESATQGLAKLETQRNERAKELAGQQGKLDDLAKQLSGMDVFQLKMNDTSLSDVINGMKSKLGIPTAGVPGMENGNGANGAGTGAGTSGKSGVGGKEANSIATGGSKTTHITLNLGNLVQTMTIHAGNVKEGAQKIRDIVLDELSRSLLMVQANV